DLTPNDAVLGVSYPAVSVLSTDVLAYNTSVQQGADDLVAQIGRLRLVCGTQFPVLLTGFSQGAHVVPTAPERLHHHAPPSDPTWQSVDGVALFASPRFDPDDPTARGTFVGDYPDNGIAVGAPIRTRFTNVTRSYCALGDPVCVFSAQNLASYKVHAAGGTGQ